MTLDPKAMEAAARAICVNPDEVTMGSGSTGSTESETIVYRRAWQDVLPIAQAAITAYLAALASSPPAVPSGWEQAADVLWTVGTHHSWWKSSVHNWRDLDPIAKSEFLAIVDRLSASPSPPALDGAAPDNVLTDIWTAYAKARAKHAPMHGPHEGYAVLLEEVDELWDEVKRWQPDDQNATAMRKEALHVAAMALAFLLEVVPAPPKETP